MVRSTVTRVKGNFMNHKYIFFAIIYFLCISFYNNLRAEELKDWKITIKDDKTENIKREKLEANWSEVEIPISFDDIVHTKSKTLWLRKEITLDKNQQYSLLISNINGKMDIYFNEILLKSGPQYPQSSLLVILPMNLYKDDINVIAIKFYLNSVVENGIHGDINLLKTKDAIKEYYYNNYKHLFISVFYIGIGIFLLSLYLRFRNEVYLFLFLFYFVIGFSSIFSTDIILERIFSPNIFYNLSLGLPVFLPILFIRFFSAYFQRSYIFNKFDFRIGFLFFLIIFITGFFNIYYAKFLNILWILIFLIVFLYSVYLIFLNLSENITFRNILTLICLVYLTIVVLNSLLDWNYFRENRFLFRYDVFFIVSVPIILILSEIIELQKNIEKKEEQFQSFDILQTKLFSYILMALKVPIKEIIETLPKVNTKDLTPNQIKNITFHLEDLEKNLNDILELARLEALEEPESYIPINVKDFLSALLSKSNISSTINVDENLVIETSLELVNSLLIRLIDFPGFGSFQHIDLVILSDENNNIFFKFFLYNRNINVVNRIYNILREKLPDQERLWVQWKIIKETIRILGGDLKIRLFSKKYLYIEFTLKAKNYDQQKSLLLKSKREKGIPLVYLYYINENKEEKQELKLGTSKKTFWTKIKEMLHKRIA